MAYSKSKAADTLGISKDELKKRAKAAGFDNTEAYYNFIGGAAAPMIQQITQQIIELDRQLDNLPGISLTEQEKQNFLNKAVEQVQPYYDRKKTEIEAGIKEGKIRSAEDVLLFTRDTENEVKDTLSNLDLNQADTEEDFINRLTDITSSKEEDVAAKKEEWRMKLETVKMNQIQTGMFSSGIGAKKRAEIDRLKNMETGTIESQAQREQQGLETNKKYNLEQIRLAREAAQRDRAARIGAPATQQAMQELGINDLSQLGGKTDIEMQRAQDARNITTYKPEALTSLEEERLKSVESRKQELQDEELTLRNQEYEKQRQKILADRAAAQSRLSAYRG